MIMVECSHPGCSVLIPKGSGGRCHEHQRKREDRHTLNFRQRGYTSGRWERFRKLVLSRYPVCVMCEAKGKSTPATVADHIVPHKGDPELMWDLKNMQGLCASCHGEKTCKEDGGFGRPQGALGRSKRPP